MRGRGRGRPRPRIGVPGTSKPGSGAPSNPLLVNREMNRAGRLKKDDSDPDIDSDWEGEKAFFTGWPRKE